MAQFYTSASVITTKTLPSENAMILAYYMIVCGFGAFVSMALEASKNRNRRSLGPYGRVSFIFILGWFLGWPTAFFIHWMNSL